MRGPLGQGVQPAFGSACRMESEDQTKENKREAHVWASSELISHPVLAFGGLGHCRKGTTLGQSLWLALQKRSPPD
jgi:hypothetical protein